MSIYRWLPLIVFPVLAATMEAQAEETIPYLEVASATPSRLIKHDVELKGPFDRQKSLAVLNGPKFFAQSVAIGEGESEQTSFYFNWYEVTRPKLTPKKTLVVRDRLRGPASYRIVLGELAYLLSPAQRVTTGAPEEIPEYVNHYNAYRVLEPKPFKQTVRLKGGTGSAETSTIKSRYICLPVEEWHHHEHFPVKTPESALMVYELTATDCDASVSIIDQFGLNTLQLTSSQFLGVPADIGK